MGESENKDRDMKELLLPLLELLFQTKTDYTHFFRYLMYYSKENEWSSLPDVPSAQVVRNSAFKSWFELYKERIDSIPEKERMQRMKNCNPKYILRNNLVQCVIQEAEKGNYELIESYLRVLEKPFDEGTPLEASTWGGILLQDSIKCSCSS